MSNLFDLRRVARIGAAAVIVAALAGCGHLPRPMSSLSEMQEASQQGNIKLVQLTAASLPAAPTKSDPEFPVSFTNAQEYAYDRLGPGDRVQIRVIESGTPTVFTSTGSSDAGVVTIDGSGNLYFPYAGTIHAAGTTVSELRDAITDRLKHVVLKPQVDVHVVETRSKLVTVQGDAGKTGVYPIERGRTRLSSLLAEVAPDQKTPEMLSVAVRRDGQTGEVRLSDIYANPRLDIALRPGDSIILNQVSGSVTILGAAGAQGQVPIVKRDFTVMDALGQAHGLNPEAADPRAVFVMRAPSQHDTAPIVYQLDMRRPETIALANRFVLGDNDAILISNAPWAVTRQVITAFAQGLAGLRSAATIPVP